MRRKGSRDCDYSANNRGYHQTRVSELTHNTGCKEEKKHRRQTCEISSDAEQDQENQRWDPGTGQRQCGHCSPVHSQSHFPSPISFPCWSHWLSFHLVLFHLSFVLVEAASAAAPHEFIILHFFFFLRFFDVDHFKSLCWLCYNTVSVLLFLRLLGIWFPYQGLNLNPLNWKVKS